MQTQKPNDQKPARLSQAAYARYRGCSRPNIHKLVRKGIIELDANGKIDVAATDDRLSRSLQPAKGGNGRGRKPGSYVAQLERHVAAKAALVELELKIKTGEYVKASDVLASGFRAYRTTRDFILAIPHRISGLLVPMSDQHEIHSFLTKEFTEALRTLAGQFDDHQSPEVKSEDRQKILQARD